MEDVHRRIEPERLFDDALGDVATALDCSESAASTLLRKGERKLVNGALGR